MLYTSPMHRRPSGVTISAAILGIISLFLFLVGVFYITVAVLFARAPEIALSAPGTQAPPPHLLPFVFGFMALMTLICAAWGLSTFVGLLRMSRWSRISIMIIGGCIAAFSLLQLFGCIIAQIAMKNFVPPPNYGSTNLVPPDPNALQAVFFIGEATCVCIAAIGIWWLVYFARKRTREAFALVPLRPTLTSTAQLNPATPITDFSVAYPIDPVQPTATEVAAPIAVVHERPISMTIVAALMFLAALSMLMCCLVPFPLFFFGMKFSGWSAHVLLISLAALYAVAGFGLLKRIHLGWLLAVGLQLLGLLNVLTMLSPPIRNHWLSYMRQTMASTQSMMPAMPGNTLASTQMLQQKMMSMVMVPGLILGVVYVLVVLVLLWRARWAYKSSE